MPKFDSLVNDSHHHYHHHHHQVTLTAWISMTLSLSLSLSLSPSLFISLSVLNIHYFKLQRSIEFLFLAFFICLLLLFSKVVWLQVFLSNTNN